MVAALSLALVALIAVAPSLFKGSLAAWLGTRLGVPVSVAWISWNPLVGRINLHGVRIGAASEAAPIMTIGDVRVQVTLRSLLAGTPVIRELVLERPWVGLTRVQGGDFNITTLLQAVRSTPAEPAPADAARTVTVRRLRVEEGTIAFRDETTTPVLETSLYLEDIIADDLALALSGTADVTLHVESRLEREPLTLDVAYRASGLDSSLRARLTTSGASLARTFLYLPIGWQQVSGTLDAVIDYAHGVEGGRLRTHTIEAQATIHDLALTESWAPSPTVRAKTVRCRALAVDFIRRRTDLGTIRLENFDGLIARDARGIRVPLVDAARAAPDTSWRTLLSAVELGTGTILLREVVPGAEPELQAQVRAGAIRQTKDGLTFSLDGTLSHGRVALRGRSAGASTDLRFGLEGLALPELADRFQLPVRFASGTVDGILSGQFGSGPARFSGTLRVPGAKSVAPAGADAGEVFAWHDLTLELAESTLDPLAIHIRRVTAGWPYLMVHRGPRGVFPFSNLAAGDSGGAGGAAQNRTPANPGTGEADPQPPVLRVDEGETSGGRVEFYDTTFPTPYWSELAEVAVSLRNVSLRPPVVERFELRSALDWISPSEAAGTFGTNESNARVAIESLRLAPLHPYLEPALGYRITSGLARVDAALTLEGTMLTARGDVVLSRFAMARTGDELFESALGMPLSVALALMKDYRGDIRLPLTVRGDLAAQQYHVGNLLLTGLREALVGTLRAPLTLFASVFRRDEPERFDLQPIPFAPGRAVLTAEGEERVAGLARLLANHSTLRAVLILDPSPADAAVLREEEAMARLEASTHPRSDIEEEVLAYLRARHTGARGSLRREAAQALATMAAAVPTPLERLRTLADARGALLLRRLTEVHGIDTSRVSRAPWDGAEPRPETVPGVDVQLRGD